MIDYLIELGNWVWGWYGDPDNQNKSNAITAAITVIILILGIIGTALWWLAKPLLAGKPTPPPDTALPPSIPTITMSLDDFQQKLGERTAEVRKELETASGDEIEVLKNQLANLADQRANPDQALQEAKERIAKLETLLERAGNDIGGERLNKARTALEAGDYSLADDIFAQIEARADLEVQSAARAAYGRGEIAEAEIRWHDAASHYSKAARLDPGYESLNKAGEFLWRAGQHRQAIQTHEDLVELAQRDYGDRDAKTATAMNNLAICYKFAGNYDAAEPLYHRALDIDAKTIGNDHPHYATHLNNLAELLRDKGNDEAAEPLYRQALDIGIKTIGTDHPDYAIHLNNLAGVLRAKGDYDAADPLYRQALDIDAKTIGTDHPSYATHLNNLAGLLRAKGDYVAAEPLLRQAVSVIEAALGAEHPNSQTVRAHLERLLREKP